MGLAQSSAWDRSLRLLTQGRNLEHPFAKLIPQPHHFNRETFRSCQVNGTHFEVDISDLIDWHLYFGFADNGLETLLAEVHEGDVIIDVGAHVGSVTLPLSKKVKSSGQVVALEPHPKTFRRLQTNCLRNPSQNITLMNLAASDHVGTVSFASEVLHNSGQNRVRQCEDGEVVCRPLDQICADLNRVELIKIDTEGFEFQVLKGAKNILQTHRPQIFFEFSTQLLSQAGTDPSRLLSFLNEIGYSCLTEQRQVFVYDGQPLHCNLWGVPKI